MERLDELKQKYAAVFALMQKGGVRLDHLHVQDNKLYMQGAVASEDLKNRIWNVIKSVDATYSDLTCDLSVDTSLPAPPSDSQAAPATSTYTVEPGDSLWKIAQKLLGAGHRFPEIIAANPGKLKDEHTVIHPGDKLVIPAH